MAAARTTSPAKKPSKTLTKAPAKIAKATTAKPKKTAAPAKANKAPAPKKTAATEAPPLDAAAKRQARVFAMSFASVYPLYVQKAEKKGRTKAEVDTVITWLTGYDDAGLRRVIADKSDFTTFFANAPKMNPNVGLITGVVCGVRVEEVEHPLMQKVRWMDKLVDELAQGRKLDRILRS